MESRGLRNVEGLKVEKGKKDRTLIKRTTGFSQIKGFG